MIRSDERKGDGAKGLGSTRRPASGKSEASGIHAGLASALRAEMLKSRHGAGGRVLVGMTLPMPALALGIAMAFPGAGPSYSFWNYFYVLFFPIALALACTSIARADARLGNRTLLSSGAPLKRLWMAKALWCLGLAIAANLLAALIFAIAGMTAPNQAVPAAAAFSCALVIALADAWMIPLSLFMTNRFGTLAGIAVPSAISLLSTVSWGIPAWYLVPSLAGPTLPSAFIPVLPSAEAMEAGDALFSSLGSFGVEQAVSLGLALALFALLCVMTSIWFAGSEEAR